MPTFSHYAYFDIKSYSKLPIFSGKLSVELACNTLYFLLSSFSVI